MADRNTFFDTRIEKLRGIYPPQKAELLNKELAIFTYGDLIEHYPFRYEDRTQFYTVAELNETMAGAQIKGRIKTWEKLGEGHKERLIAYFTDGTGTIELVWFQGIAWAEKNIRPNGEYIIYGKPTLFGSKWQISHPEMESING